MNKITGSLALALFTLGPLAARAQQLPEGPGRDELRQYCVGCHEVARSVAPRLDRQGWVQTIDKMTTLGLKAPEADLNLVLDYLAKNYPADEVPKLNVNQATQIEFESRLSLPRSQAKALLLHREKLGGFKILADLLSAPGVDKAKIEARKDRIAF